MRSFSLSLILAVLLAANAPALSQVLLEAEGDYTFVVSEPIDDMPDAFNFKAETNVAPGSVIQSTVQTVSGINTSVPISISNGTFNTGSGFQSTPGTVSNLATFYVRGQASAAYSTTVPVTLTVGGRTTVWNITTRAASTSPSAFSFGARIGTSMTGTKDSPIVTISGIEAGCGTGSMAQGAYRVDTGATLTRSSHYWRKNGGTWTNASQTVCNGDTVQAQVNVSAAGAAYIWWTRVTIGTQSATFEVQK